MDAIDVGILRTMGVQPFGPQAQHRDAMKPTFIAKHLGLAPETVRERIQRMESAGLIAGYQAYPNLRHFGLETTGLLFDVKDERRRAGLAQALATVEGLLGAHHFLSSDVCIDLTYQTPNEFQRRRQLLATVCGDPEPAPFFGWHLPPLRRTLTRLDWRIIHGLRGRAKRPLPQLAQELRVGYRTVKRHYDRLVDEGSVWICPRIVFGESSGVIPFWMFVYLRPDAAADTPGTVAKAFDAQRVYADVPGSPEFGNFGMILFANSTGEVEELRRTAAHMPGVERARVLVPHDETPLDAWIDDRIHTALQEPAKVLA